MRPDCQLRVFNTEVTGSFTIALSPCSHSCPSTLIPSFGNDGESCCGWCIALSFHGTSMSSVISPNSFGPSLAILGRFPPRPGPLVLIVEMGRGTQILWPHNNSSYDIVLISPHDNLRLHSCKKRKTQRSCIKKRLEQISYNLKLSLIQLCTIDVMVAPQIQSPCGVREGKGQG